MWIFHGYVSLLEGTLPETTLSPINPWVQWKMAKYLKDNDPIGDTPIFHWTMIVEGRVTKINNLNETTTFFCINVSPTSIFFHSMKLAFSRLKIDGWKMIRLPLGWHFFQVLLLLVSGEGKKLGTRWGASGLYQIIIPCFDPIQFGMVYVKHASTLIVFELVLPWSMIDYCNESILSYEPYEEKNPFWMTVGTGSAVFATFWFNLANNADTFQNEASASINSCTPTSM